MPRNPGGELGNFEQAGGAYAPREATERTAGELGHLERELRETRIQLAQVRSRLATMPDQVHGPISELAEQRLHASEKLLLEAVAGGMPLNEVLHGLCTAIERARPGSHCSVLLLEGDCLRHAAAPSLPAEYTRAVDGFRIGPEVGSCGAAAALGRCVVAEDIATDPRWAPAKDLALGHGLRSCWSTPILAADRTVLGTFAIYTGEPHTPLPGELRITERAVHLAAIAIERWRNNESLRRSEEQFRILAEVMPQLVWTSFPDGQIEYCNSRWRGYTGLSDDDVRGCGWTKALHPDDHDATMEAWNRATRTGEEYQTEQRLRGRDGEYRWFLTRALPQRDPDGRVIRWLGTCTDIQDRKAAEQSLRYQLELTRAVTQNAADPLFVIDRRGRVTFANPAAEEAFGFGLSDLEGRNLHDLVHHHKRNGDPFPVTDCPLVAAYSSGRILHDHEDLFFRKDGGTVEVSCSIAPLASGSLSGSVLIARDITERKRARLRLRESEEKFRTTFEQAAVGIAHVDMDGRWRLVNEGLCRIVGYNRAELLAKSFQEITHPDDVAADVSQARRLAAGEIQTYSMEKRYIRRDGARVWVSMTVSLVRDEQDRPDHFIVIAQDISDRKAAEERLARQTEQLRTQAQELARSNADLEDFAHIASHDLKEPLRGISLYASFLLEDLGPSLDDQARSKLEGLVRLARRMHDLLESLLEFSRLGRAPLRLSEVPLDRVAAAAFDMLRTRLADDRVEVRVQGRLPTVRCDQNRVAQVLANLIANGIKYNRSSPKRVEIGCVDDALPPVIYVRDNGIGIAPGNTDRIFQMFKRLHDRDDYGGGTGAGLAIVKKIVERHGGRVWLESTPGEGSTFYFTLERPRPSTPAAAGTPAIPTVQPSLAPLTPPPHLDR